jgi:UDP-N-acetylglucosamine:LPS N-acetylglucosamine transferase
MTDLLIVCSPGGHFVEARKLVNGFENITYRFITHDLKVYCNQKNIVTVPHVNRNLLFFVQIFFAIYWIWKERPKVILSTGSSIAVSFFLVAKFFRIKTIYVESPTRVKNPSLTLKIVRFLGPRIYVRYRSLQKKIPGSLYIANK